MQRVGKVGGSSRSDTDGFDPSLWTPTRLAGSRIARNLEKQTNYQSNVFAEGRKSRSDTDGLNPCLWTATPLALRSHGSADNFIGETQGLLYLHPSLLRSKKKHFRDFHDFTLWWGTPLGTISGAKRDKCRNCGKKLAIDGKVFPVFIYSCQRGSCSGSRLTKHCHYCKLYEHYRYYSMNGTRQYDRDVLSLDLGSGICETPLVDRQNLTAKALPHSILEFNAFNAFNARLKG